MIVVPGTPIQGLQEAISPTASPRCKGKLGLHNDASPLSITNIEINGSAVIDTITSGTGTGVCWLVGNQEEWKALLMGH